MFVSVDMLWFLCTNGITCQEEEVRIYGKLELATRQFGQVTNWSEKKIVREVLHVAIDCRRRVRVRLEMNKVKLT